MGWWSVRKVSYRRNRENNHTVLLITSIVWWHYKNIKLLDTFLTSTWLSQIIKARLRECFNGKFCVYNLQRSLLTHLVLHIPSPLTSYIYVYYLVQLDRLLRYLINYIILFKPDQFPTHTVGRIITELVVISNLICLFSRAF